MPVILRGADDLLLDGMMAKLEAFRVRETAISAAVDFELDRDRVAPWKDLTKPLVNLEIETDEPDDKALGFAATIKAYCFAPEARDKNSEEVGPSRMYYLKEQVRIALIALSDFDLGQTLGTVHIENPSWARIHFQDREMEETIFAGAWTFRVAYAWDPEDSITGTLTDIQVSAGPTALTALWAAAYHYGGD
jgi:hypothetical protein